MKAKEGKSQAPAKSRPVPATRVSAPHFEPPTVFRLAGRAVLATPLLQIGLDPITGVAVMRYVNS